MTGSVDSKRMLAEEYARRGDYGAAIEIYRDTLVGHFADDSALLMGTDVDQPRNLAKSVTVE
jgi:hypothetical protein